MFLKTTQNNTLMIGQFVKHKGYVGNIMYDPEDKIYYGQLLDIDDSVNYHADNIIDLYKHYHEAIDDYVELKREIEQDLVCVSN